ncbi:MAG: hypothetical protein JWQ42_2452 [Edaphobacter sp.]|nr:hypothetical protein [Edaphobacter sp.]
MLSLGLVVFSAQAACRYSNAQTAPPNVEDTVGVNVTFRDFRALLHSGSGKTFFRNTGIKWVRTDLQWQTVESPTPGQYNYDWTCNDPSKDSCVDDFVNSLPSGVKPYFILDYSNPFYEAASGHCVTVVNGVTTPDFSKTCFSVTDTHPPVTIPGFTTFSAAAVGRYAGRGFIWEIWNEPNSSTFWPGNAAYSELALPTSQYVHQNYPNEYLVGPALAASLPQGCPLADVSGNEVVDTTALDSLIGQGNTAAELQYWSGLSVHLYRALSPEAANCDVQILESTIKSNLFNPTGKNIDILSGEWGYGAIQPIMPNSAQDVNEYQQAEYLSRMWLYNAALGLKLSIWYDWHDPDPTQKQGYGIVRFQSNPPFTTGDSYTPKLAYYAATAIVGPTTGYFRGFHFDSANPNNQIASPNIVLAFSNGTETRYAAWTTSGSASLQLNVPNGEYFVVSNLGSALSFSTVTGSLQLQLTEAPQFVLSPPNPVTFAVDELFMQVLGRNPTAAELQTYSAELSNGVSVSNIIQALVQATQAQSAISGLYTQYQGAPPTAHQLACSTTALEGGTSWTALVDSIRSFPPPASPSLTSLLSGNYDHVYYSNCSPQVNELRRTGTTWVSENPSTWAAESQAQPNQCKSFPSGHYPTCPPNVSSASSSNGTANALTSLLYTGNEDHVWYIGSDQNETFDRQHVWELWWDGTNWQDADLIQWTGAPAAAIGSSLTSLLYPGNEDHVEYIGSDLHVHELWYDGSAWQTTDLSQQTGAPNAASPSALTSLLYAGNQDHVEYIGSDNHVHELWYNGSIWHTTDLTQQTGAPNAASRSALSSLLYPVNEDHVWYIGSDQHVHEFWYNGSIWQTADLTQWTGAPNAASASPLTSLLYAGNQDHVCFVGSDQHVHEFWYNGSTWQTSDLTQWTGAPNASSPSALSSLLYPVNEDHVWYIGSDQHMHESWYNGSTWQTSDLTQWTGAPL